jgi:hypothetical protein
MQCDSLSEPPRRAWQAENELAGSTVIGQIQDIDREKRVAL